MLVGPVIHGSGEAEPVDGLHHVPGAQPGRVGPEHVGQHLVGQGLPLLQVNWSILMCSETGDG